MKRQWYRKHMCPWGYAIGHYEESFPIVRGITRSIHRHYTPKGRFKFYSFTREKTAGRPRHPSDAWVYRSKSLKATLSALRRDTRP